MDGARGTRQAAEQSSSYPTLATKTETWRGLGTRSWWSTTVNPSSQKRDMGHPAKALTFWIKPVAFSLSLSLSVKGNTLQVAPLLVCPGALRNTATGARIACFY